MNISEIKIRAREQLEYKIFGNNWLTAVLVCFIFSSLITALSFSVVGIILASGPLSYGISKIFVKQARDRQPIRITDLFKGFTEDLSNNFLLGLMEKLYVFLWGLLFIVPGIIKMYSYSMAYYIKADYPSYTWRECLNYSQQMMKGYKWKHFMLDLSFIGWYIVGALCFGIGTIWVEAYHQAATAHFYATLLEKNQYKNATFTETF